MQSQFSIFEYDKELFLSLNKDEKNYFTQTHINNIASNLNDNNLIVKDMSPNANIIYHIYSDCTITRQKGGWAYGQRSIFDVEYACIKSNTFFTFPNKGDNKGDTYAIMTLENCRKIKEIVKELLL